MSYVVCHQSSSFSCFLHRQSQPWHHLPPKLKAGNPVGMVPICIGTEAQFLSQLLHTLRNELYSLITQMSSKTEEMHSEQSGLPSHTRALLCLAQHPSFKQRQWIHSSAPGVPAAVAPHSPFTSTRPHSPFNNILLCSGQGGRRSQTRLSLGSQPGGTHSDPSTWGRELSKRTVVHSDGGWKALRKGRQQQSRSLAGGMQFSR